MVDKIFMKQLSWKDLFTRHSFFTNAYKYYLSITASSRTKEAEAIWSGLVESKLRHLVGALDRKSVIAVAHPFPKGFERVHVTQNESEVEEVKNGSTKYQAKGTSTETTDETKDAAHQAAAQTGAENVTVPEPSEKPVQNDGSPNMYTTTYYIGLELNALEQGMKLHRVLSNPSNRSRCPTVFGYLDRLSDIQIYLHIMAWVSARSNGPSRHSCSQVSHCLIARTKSFLSHHFTVSICQMIYSSLAKPAQSGKPRKFRERMYRRPTEPVMAKSEASMSWT